MSGVTSILVGLFGVVWTLVVASSGGGVFSLFGVIFVIIAVVQAIYNFKNATSENRYSSFDITDENEEIDPWNQRFKNTEYKTYTHSHGEKGTSSYCPYCGAKAEKDFRFCQNCGKELP